jgi:hypothetical protein
LVFFFLLFTASHSSIFSPSGNLTAIFKFPEPLGIKDASAYCVANLFPSGGAAAPFFNVVFFLLFFF